MGEDGGYKSRKKRINFLIGKNIVMIVLRIKGRKKKLLGGTFETPEIPCARRRSGRPGKTDRVE